MSIILEGEPWIEWLKENAPEELEEYRHLLSEIEKADGDTDASE
jgi:hypothetical protein